MNSNNNYYSNRAINKSDEDIYNFTPYASKVQNAIRNSGISDEPIVFGVYGKWGQGKTSFLNLLFNNLEKNSPEGAKKIIKFRFNPWRYNSEEKLIFEFFKGLTRVINHDYSNPDTKHLITKIRKYSKYILTGSKVKGEIGLNFPFKWTFKTSKSFNETFNCYDINKNQSIESLKDSINEELKKFAFRIVIFIDDIDRINKKELYNIFRLVKLTASFNNLTFILAFDNDMVAKSIYNNYGNSVEDGYRYLEKIINIPITLPKVDNASILKELTKKLNIIFSNNKISLDNSDKIQKSHDFSTGTNRFMAEIESIEECINTPRLLIRLLNSFSTNLIALKNEVNYSDLIWLELLKIKYLKVYEYIKKNPKHFVKLGITSLLSDDSDNYKNNLREFLMQEEYSIYDQDEILRITRVLFPIIEKSSFPHLNAKLNDAVEVKQKFDLSHLERRINHIDCFNMFFNFHTIGFIPNEAIDDLFKSLQSELSYDHSVKELERIINNSNGEKLRYELGLRLDKTNDKDLKLKLLTFFLKTIDLITNDDKENSYVSNTVRESFIYKIFKNLTILDEATIIKFINERTKNFSTIDLLYVRKGLYHDQFENSSIQLKIDKLFIKNIKEEYKTIGFFVNNEGSMSRSIMAIWNKINHKELNAYLKKILSTQNVTEFIKSFPTNWQESSGFRLDELTQENYNNLKSFIDPKIVFDYIVQLHPTLISSNFHFESLIWDLRGDIDDVDYCAQFAFYYITENSPTSN